MKGIFLSAIQCQCGDCALPPHAAAPAQAQNHTKVCTLRNIPSGGETQVPSSKILEQKKQIVAELAEQIKNSPAGVLVNYQGITVTDDTKMRRALREAGVRYTVMKNSLTGRALERVGYGDLKEHLVGMTAIAIAGNDPVAPAKIIKEYADKIKSFRILAGYLEGKTIDADTVISLANTPSREVLIAKFLGSIQSPLYSLAYVLQAIVDKNGDTEAAASNA